MAALRIEGVGTIHLCADRCDQEDRVVYRYIVEDADGCQLGSGCNLRSGVGADVDYTRTMCGLLGFLADDAEQTGTAAQEWAYRTPTSSTWPGWSWGRTRSHPTMRSGQPIVSCCRRSPGREASQMAKQRRRAAPVELLTPDALVLAQVVELAEGDLQRVQWLSPERAIVWNSRLARMEHEHEVEATDPKLLPPELRRSRIISKLDAANRTEASAIARNLGLID